MCVFSAFLISATAFVVSVALTFTIEYTDTVSAENLAAANFVGLMCILAAIAFFVGAWPSNKRFVIPKRAVVIIVVLFLLAIGIDSAIPLDEISAYALGVVLIWVICVSAFTIAAAVVCAKMRRGRWSKAGLGKPT